MGLDDPLLPAVLHRALVVAVHQVHVRPRDVPGVEEQGRGAPVPAPQVALLLLGLHGGGGGVDRQGVPPGHLAGTPTTCSA